MKLPGDLVNLLKAGESAVAVVYLATASKEGNPNILAVPFSDIVNDELILLPDLFAQKTKVNINENNHASLSFFSENRNVTYVLEGTVDIIQWGHPGNFKLFGLKASDVLSRWGDWDEFIEPVIEAKNEFVRPAVFAQRGVIVFKPAEIKEAVV
jgi:hypothetical protein